MGKKKHKQRAVRQQPQGGKKFQAASSASATQQQVAATSTVGTITGLQNIGNTCYFNSFVQSLGCVCNLIPIDSSSSVGQLSAAIEIMMESVRRTYFRTTSSNPTPLHNVVVKCAPQFKGRRQQDSHELFMYVISELSDEYKRFEDKETFFSYSSFFAGKLVSVLTCEECGSTLHNVEETFDLSLQIPGAESLMTLPPVVAKAKNKKKGDKGSKLGSQNTFSVLAEIEKSDAEENDADAVVGNTQKVSFDDVAVVQVSDPSFSPTELEEGIEPIAETLLSEEFDFNSREEALNLEYPTHSRPLWSKEESSVVSIVNCLDAFTAHEILCKELGNAHRCQRCCAGKIKDFSTRSNKRILLLDSPRVLSIHLKRLLPGGKCNTFVEFPEYLDMSDYIATRIDSNDQPPQSTNYRLLSVIVHQGGASGGHYVAYVKRNTEWFYTSDSHVTRSSLGEVLKQQAYMLYYLCDDGMQEASGDDVHASDLDDLVNDDELATYLSSELNNDGDEIRGDKITRFKLMLVDGQQVYVREDDDIEIGLADSIESSTEDVLSSPRLEDTSLSEELSEKLTIGVNLG